MPPSLSRRSKNFGALQVQGIFADFFGITGVDL